MKKPLKVDLSGFFIFPVVVSLNCLLTNSLVIYLRYAFASNPFQVRSLEWELHGTYYGLTWEVHGNKNPSYINIAVHIQGVKYLITTNNRD